MWIFDNHRVQAALLKIASFWPAKYDAPYVAAPMSVIRRMLELAEVGPEDVVYDLGCGDGRTVITAAREYGASGIGIELDPIRYLWCQMLVTFMRLRGRVKIIHGNFFKEDLSEADVIICYMGQGANEMIQGKFKQELKPNTRVVSYNFTFPDLDLVGQGDEAELFLYKSK